jgi:hypothetical protein
MKENKRTNDEKYVSRHEQVSGAETIRNCLSTIVAGIVSEIN